MASKTPVVLPTINFSRPNLVPGSPHWDSVKAQVKQALEECGCFEAFYNEIPLEIQKELFGAMEDAFDLPLETKMRNASDHKPFHGYVGQQPSMPLYESLGFDNSDDLEKLQSHTHLLWPQGNPRFCNTIQSFSKQLSELDQMIRRMIVENLGVEEYLDEHMGSTNYLLRLMKYQGPRTFEKETGLIAHADKNIVSILYQNQVDGLEVQTKDGDWIKVKFTPNTFIVVIGESFKAWANGRLHPALHRVVMTGNKIRYSLALFSVPKEGYIIKALEELVDEEHPLLYKPFDYYEFLDDRYKENILATESALKRCHGV